MKNPMLDALNEYLENTPPEKLKSDWDSLEKWSGVGPSVEEYLDIVKKNMSVDLKEILAKHISKRLFEHGNAREEVCDSVAKTSIDGGHYAEVIEAMKEACERVLYLAAESAECRLKNKIECTISQLENGFEIGNNAIVINKQSILDTINQVK